MKRLAQIIHSSSTDPWFNLALEEYLVRSISDLAVQGIEKVVLYLWQNDHTVVIGRNQNAWNECRTGLLEEEGGKLARRSTGGGAVYHDLGNLNFSIITPKAMYDVRRSLGTIVEAVRSAGIPAALSGRNDILADGRKFSGNAFLVQREAGLHHGTILVHSDYDKIARYLNVSREKLESKGVRSVQSRVVNLSELLPSVTVGQMKDQADRAFIAEYAPDEIVRDFDVRDVPGGDFRQIHDKYRSWEWRYGESMRFTQSVGRYFDWGSVQILFEVENGLVKNAKAYTDAMDSAFFGDLPDRLPGIRFTSKDIAAAVEAVPETGEIMDLTGYDVRKDLCAFIRSLEL